MRHPEREPGRTEAKSSERHEVRGRERSYQLSDDQLQTLRTVGTFRTVDAKDIPERDVKQLVASGLIEKNTIPRRDWTRLDVLVLSREGERVLSSRQSPDDAQRFHSGFVKLRELEHDAAIYPAFRDAAEAIERAGGKVERVVLDYELKSVINSEMNRGGAVSGEARDERKAQLAKDLDLEIVDGKLPLPDLRVEYTDEHGERHHEDIEIVSRHYHGAHLAGKSAAGFKLVSQSGGNSSVLDHYDKGLV